MLKMNSVRIKRLRNPASIIRERAEDNPPPRKSIERRSAKSANRAKQAKMSVAPIKAVNTMLGSTFITASMRGPMARPCKAPKAIKESENSNPKCAD